MENQCDGCKAGYPVNKQGIHIVPYPSGNMVCQKNKYIESSTNSPIGSYHWFHTLMSQSLHIGEYLKDNTPTEEILRIWGKTLFENSKELINGFKEINKND